MRAWPADAPDPRQSDLEETLRELEERGIDLNPTGDGRVHDDSDGHGAADDHPHPHPHAHTNAGDQPVIGIVGGGAVGSALGAALSRAGWPVGAIATRDPVRRARFQTYVPGARAFAEAVALIDAVDLIILAVPDDALPGIAGSLRLYGGQVLVHTSGALGAEVLEPAMAAGTQIGSFHPLVAFADVELSVEALRGATIAIEGDDQLATLLAEMAEAIGATAVRLAPGSKAAYHAAAVLAAGGFVALLDTIVELGAVTGLDEHGSLAIYGRLAEQTLANARALGVARALTGPITRGDVGTVNGHLAAMRLHAPDAVRLYIALAEREVALAERRGVLAPDVADLLRRSLAAGG
ncbi:MAG: DUF2520 domain-containing protein [Chloroflexota bacterium]